MKKIIFEVFMKIYNFENITMNESDLPKVIYKEFLIIKNILEILKYFQITDLLI